MTFCCCAPKCSIQRPGLCSFLSSPNVAGYQHEANVRNVIYLPLNNRSFHSEVQRCDESIFNNEDNYITLTRTVSDNRSCKFLAPVSASSHYTLERFLSSAAERGIRASVNFKYGLKLENKMTVIVLGMSRNITLLNIAIEGVAFLLFIHEVTYSNLDLDTSHPQAVHQSPRQIPEYHLKHQDIISD